MFSKNQKSEKICQAVYAKESPQSTYLQWSYDGVGRSELAQEYLLSRS